MSLLAHHSRPSSARRLTFAGPSSTAYTAIDLPIPSGPPIRPPLPLLLARARVTNLALAILIGLCALSLFFNFRSRASRASPPNPSASLAHPLASHSHPALPSSASGLSRLVIVPGHSIYIGNDPALVDPLKASQWILEPYQSIDAVHSFIDHIRTGISTAANDPRALLIYSGGQTRAKSNETTEASSYSRLANLLDLPHQYHLDLNRITTEEFALDSWTNLLYSVSRFKEFTGRYPQDITVIGYAIKSKRFQDLHRKALRWPSSRFEYIGLDQFSSSSSYQNTQDQKFQSQNQNEILFNTISQGERKVYKEFEKDLYGCHQSLKDKKQFRNRFRRFPSYQITCPEILGLLSWCPANGIDEYNGPLPWTN